MNEGINFAFGGFDGLLLSGHFIALVITEHGQVSLVVARILEIFNTSAVPVERETLKSGRDDRRQTMLEAQT